MKNFIKENWYKLMIGSSMMMASFGFMIYTISPAYSNSEKEKTEIKNTGISNSPVGTNVWNDGTYAYFVDGGYVYCCNKDKVGQFFGWLNSSNKWNGTSWGWTGSSGTFYEEGRKIKLP
jgi:hypothetical protein